MIATVSNKTPGKPGERITSPDDSIDFGPAVAALVALSGTSADRVATQAAMMLAGLAGPRVGLVTLGGEFQPVGSSLISVAGDSAVQSRLTELLFNPLRYLQDDLIEYSRRVDPKLLERLSTSLADPHHKDYGQRHPVAEETQAEAELRHAIGLAGKSTEVVSTSHPIDRYEAFQREYSKTEEQREEDANFAAMCHLAHVDFETVLELNEARCLREPLVLLENPDAGILLRRLVQVDRQSPMVLDANGSLLAGTFGRSRHKAAHVIEGLLSGRGTCEAGDGLLSPTRGALFSVIDRDRLAALVGSSELGSYLSRAMLVDPTPQEGSENASIDVEAIKSGYEQYRAAVKRVLRLRRLDAPGVAPILGDTAAEQFFRAQRQFQNQIEEVEPRLKPFAANHVCLPATMLWSLERLCPGQRYADLIPTAIYLAEVAMKTHLGLIKQALEAGVRQKLEEEGLVMLRKLRQYEPCRFRDIYRNYDDQDVSLHRPVFNYLLETDRVQQVEKGVYQVTERGRIELEGVGVN